MFEENKLINAIVNEDFDETHKILTDIYNDDNGKMCVEFLITFIMENSDVDYGMPGPVVHFIEKYPIDFYVEFLLKAIKTRPNETLLWMLNRIINSPFVTGKKDYLEILKSTSERNDIAEVTKEVAKRFYDYQISV